MRPQLVNGNPVAGIFIIETRRNFAAHSGVALVAQVDEISRQMVLIRLRQLGQTVFNFLQTHGGSITRLVRFRQVIGRGLIPHGQELGLWFENESIRVVVRASKAGHRPALRPSSADF